MKLNACQNFDGLLTTTPYRQLCQTQLVKSPWRHLNVTFLGRSTPLLDRLDDSWEPTIGWNRFMASQMVQTRTNSVHGAGNSQYVVPSAFLSAPASENITVASTDFPQSWSLEQNAWRSVASWLRGFACLHSLSDSVAVARHVYKTQGPRRFPLYDFLANIIMTINVALTTECAYNADVQYQDGLACEQGLQG